MLVVDPGFLLDALQTELGGGLSFASPPELLGGGFYTANYLMRVIGGPPGWEGSVVLRLFPDHAPPQLAEREVQAQALASAHGIPAPTVLLYRHGARIAGRQWFVMTALPGRALMGGTAASDIVRLAPVLLRHLPRLTAQTQLALHAIDASPLVDALGDAEAGVGHWLDVLSARVEADAEGLRAGLAWLRTHQPALQGHPVLCHGDLWGGNMLVDGTTVTGVIDWTLATAADPAFDVGFTTMSLWLTPVPLPRAALAGVRFVSRWLARRYLRIYRRHSNADLSTVNYYEALRCVLELSGVTAYRSADAEHPYDGPRPTWDWVADDVIEYFRDRTGVALTIPQST